MADNNSTEFRDNAQSMGEPSMAAFPAFKDAFNVVNNKAALEEQLDLVKDEAAKNKQSVHADLEIARQVNAEQSNVSISKTFGASAKRGQDQKTKNAQKASAHVMFMALLDQLRAQAEQAIDDLRGKYGEDYENTMLSLVLADEEREGKTIEEQKQTAYAKYLNDDGSIKKNFQDHPMAEDIQKLYKVDQAREFAAKVEREGLTEENKQEIKELGWKEASEFRKNTNDGEAREHSEKSSDVKIAKSETNALTVGFGASV